MSVVAFIVIAFMLTAYVILDGYDLGIASITPFVAKNDPERASTMHAIGPFWNGNEVWLLAAGGTLFALFPQAYASSFSGFYLPFMVVLWLLMFRGISIELRSHFPSQIWHTFWDACFAGASALLVLIFGVALGNLVRGLPLDPNGYFLGTFGFLLNPYALLVGIFAIVTLAQHGAGFLLLRLEGPPADRARIMRPRLLIATLILFLAVTVATSFVRPPTLGAWIDILPLLALAMLVWTWYENRRGGDLPAFIASSLFVAILLITAAATMYPYLLPSYPAGGGLSIFQASPSPVALTSALAVTIVGLFAVIVYGAWVWRRLAGKVSVGE